jgi:hypothetical protein
VAESDEPLTPRQEFWLLLRDGYPIPTSLLSKAFSSNELDLLLPRMASEAGYTRYNIETDELVKPHAP